MVLTSRCRSHASHFRHRQHDGKHAKGDNENKPYRTCSTTVGQREHRSDNGKLPSETQHDDISDDAEKAEAALWGSVSVINCYFAIARTHLQLLPFAQSAHITLVTFRVVSLILRPCGITVGARARYGIGVDFRLLLIVMNRVCCHGYWDPLGVFSDRCSRAYGVSSWEKRMRVLVRSCKDGMLPSDSSHNADWWNVPQPDANIMAIELA